MSLSLVISGEVEAGEICGILAGMVTLWATASVAELANAPVMPTTPLTETSFWAASTAPVGMLWVSAETITSLRPPRIPPCSLTWVAASSSPARIGGE